MIAGAIVTAIATDNVAAVSFLFIILTSHITQFSQYIDTTSNSMLRIVTASSYSQSQYLHTNFILYVQRKYKMNSGTTNHIFISIKPAHETFTVYNNYPIPLLYIIIVLLIPYIIIVLLIPYIIIVLLILSILTD